MRSIIVEDCVRAALTWLLVAFEDFTVLSPSPSFVFRAVSMVTSIFSNIPNVLCRCCIELGQFKIELSTLLKMATTEEDKRTPDEKQLFDLIEKGTNEAVIAHVKASKVKIDCLDPKGMTPLQLAAFRGNKDLCEFFLANGADVNSHFHENSYSTLMFAALSGNREITRMMLEAGANVHHTNSVNRTAGQMAAFVGQHQCVSVINNFFPQSEIDYYTKPQGLEKEAKLPASVAPSLCKLINFSNLHPVKITLFLRDHAELLAESKRVCLVLSRLVEKNMKSREVNDVVALKCHFISTVVKLAAEAKENDKEKSITGWLKSLTRGRDGDGFMEFQERLIRQSLKDFPYVSSALLQQLVRQIAPVKIGNDPTAFSLLTSAINGQQFAWDAGEGCETCGEAKAEAKCSKCKMVVYCNQECQRLNWPTHKKQCARLAEQYKIQEEQKKKEEEQKRLEEEKLKEQEAEESQKAASEGDNQGGGDGVEEAKTSEAEVTPEKQEQLDPSQHEACANES
ncbi:ankyrin repeat and MYND domain-containing protein 2 [Aplysia californica]|uniref:Ankyrin repeat and MYND domain-containing protein 2 n=1 Tax=Aplysia californica TaxID=6500 RepID=A0ABM1A421_APLCA|nr:ankyrin repeat and MYND domain-containing protein 2 [Aplysia californica]